jgi:transcriptional regulator with XRE-family HTH domain
LNASPKIIRLQMEEIGRSLHGARLVKKFTLTRLSRLSGVPVSLLDRYEMGASRMRVGDLLKIALAMRLDIKDVLFEDWD